MKKITPCLWFDRNAEEAVKFYVSIFKNSKIGRISYYPKSGHPAHRGREGTPLMIEFTLNGQPFSALNGGPFFKPTGAVSFQVYCKDQKEIDYYWRRLSKGGDKRAQECGWLKDKYGYSWQICPEQVGKWLTSKDRAASARFLAAIGTMKKLDLRKLERAYLGK